ncbi:MAG: nuclear transport factor 2 family protein [Pseudomonadota bacterium]
MTAGRQTITEMETKTLEQEVKDRFQQLVAALNRKDAAAWSDFFSRDGFLSAIAGVDYYAARGAWVEVITTYFSTRERQHVEPVEVRVAALTSGLALLTSGETSEMWLTSGEHVKCRHAFTMLWQKEDAGWMILHSHESWLDD